MNRAERLDPAASHPLVYCGEPIPDEAIEAARACSLQCALCAAQPWCRALGYDPDGLLEEVEDD